MSSGERLTLPVAVHIFVLENDRLLLLRRWNTGFEDGRWGVPAGHLEGGEPAVAAAAREAYEEAGLRIADDDLVPAAVMHRLAASGERIDLFFTCRRWQGTPINREPDKCAGLRWFPVGALPEDMVEYIRAAFDLTRRGDWFGLHGWPAAD